MLCVPRSALQGAGQQPPADPRHQEDGRGLVHLRGPAHGPRGDRHALHPGPGQRSAPTPPLTLLLFGRQALLWRAENGSGRTWAAVRGPGFSLLVVSATS